MSFVVRDGSDATDRLGVAVAVTEGEDLDGVQIDRIRHALVRRYGFTPAVVTPVRPGEWPLTATGKVDRKALGERVAKSNENANGEAAPRSTDADDETILAFLWREALDLGHDFGGDDDFFDCGGDSMRAATLLMNVDKRFKRQLAFGEFFALPTFNNLLRLVRSATAPAADDQQPSLWPLPHEISRSMLSFVEGWSGERVSEDRLMLGLNRQGSAPPLFCVINAEPELTDLAEALGPEQPVYAVRSLPGVGDYDEDLVQALALRYVKDIQQAYPDGPLFLLGQCQGGKIAVAMAQHLLRRGRHLPLLILVEWTTEPVSYPGDVLLVYGRDSLLNPKFAPFNSEPSWRRMFGNFTRVEVDGGYNELYLRENIGSLAGELARRCRQALRRPSRFSPLEDCAFEFVIDKAASRARPGAGLGLEITVKNTGRAAIGGEFSSLRLGGFWTRDGAIFGPRFVEAGPLPAIAPGEVSVVKSHVFAPEDEGNFELALDLFEERGHSLTGLGAASACARVKVTRRATPIRDSLRPYFRRRKQIFA